MSDVKSRFVIIGGGTGGICAAARLAKKVDAKEIMLIEPADTHYYQPMWTLVGAGVTPKETTARPMSEVMPVGVNWVKDAVATFDPENNKVSLASGKVVEYEHLIVSPGIQLDWDAVSGVAGNVGKNGICSNYDYGTVDSTWEALRNFEGGNAIFIMAPMPIKCPGAPQKIMWLAEEYLRKKGIRDKSEVIFVTAGEALFGLPRYRDPLEALANERGIKREYSQKLTKIDAAEKKATIQHIETGEEKVIDYNMIHITPPQSSPDFIKKSPLANAEGWVDVDKHSMQHTKYKNVWGLGDAASSPNSKTGASIRKQAPVLVENLMASIKGVEGKGSYNGYASCPLVTGYHECMLAEFGYDGKIMETFPFAQNKPRYSMYLLKRYVLPTLYWDFMLKGMA